MSDSIIPMVVAICIAAGFSIGVTTQRAGWQDDCTHLGKHLANGKVYLCTTEAKP